MRVDEIGGYEREAGAAFGVGTLRPCLHAVTAVCEGTAWRGRGHELDTVYESPSWAQTGDQIGTIRCQGCGNKVEA